MKKLAYVLLTSLLVGNLGVNEVDNNKGLVSADQAKKIVLSQTNEEVKNVKVEFDKEEKKYEVEVKTETKEIEASVDTKGNVVEKEVEKVKETKPKETTLITKEKAKEIAFNHAGVKESEVTRLEVKLDKEDNEYEVDFYVGTSEYDVDINALTGKINHVEKEVEKAKEKTKSKDTTLITKEKAKEVAFNHAGVKESEVTRLEVKLDKEDNEYEVDFYVGTSEYDYDINALTGKINHVEKEAEKVKETKPKETTKITKEEAKQIALNTAGVNVNEIRDFEIELDEGRYEISFEVKNVEFEIEISLDGKVLRSEKEIDD